MRVFEPDLLVRLVEARGVAAQDRQVHVHQQLRVRVLGNGLVPGGHDQRMQPVSGVGRQPRFEHAVARPLRAALLVVVALRIVEGIVEPQREFDLPRPLRGGANLLEQVEALVEVLQRVVVPVLLAPAVDETAEQGFVGGRLPELAPAAAPAFQPHEVRAVASASFTSRPSSITAMA